MKNFLTPTYNSNKSFIPSFKFKVFKSKLKPKTKESNLVVFTKEFPKEKKGKYAIRLFLLSFLVGRLNQLNSLARMLHFYCCFRRHPY